MMSTHSTLEAPSLASHHATLPRRAGFATALRSTGAALQWRLLLWWAILLLLPTIVAALPLWQLLSASLDHSVHAARLAGKLDMLAISDLLVVGRERHGAALGSGGIVALALTLLLSPLLTGMTIAAVRAQQQAPQQAPQRLRFVPLLSAGAAHYGRLLRMLVWAVVPLGIAGAVAGMAFNAAGKTAETAILEADASHASHLAMVATVILLVLVHASIDAGRAILGNAPQRRSAFLAWWGGVKLLLRRPLSVLGSYVVVTAIGLAVASALLLARMHVPALAAGGTVAAFLLTQLGVVVLGCMRGARLAALMELAR
jgi:hypothetical protein